MGAVVLSDLAAAAVPVVAPIDPNDESTKPVNEQHKALAAKYQKRLKYFGNLLSDDVKRWKRNRKYVNGEEGEDGERGLVRVNLVASIVNTIQPNIYAKAPEVSVELEERVNPHGYAGMRDFARTLEMVLNRYAVRGANLKARGKEAVRSSLTCTTGWVKVIYQKDRREDPLVRNRINDAQDNIERIQQLLRETKDEGVCATYQASMGELHQQIQALQSKVEVVASEGIVIDNVAAEHIRILDASVKSIDEYTQASSIAHGIYMTVGAYKTQFGGKEPPKKATRYTSGDASQTEDDDAGRREGAGRTGMDDDDQLVLVWEIWSKADLTVYTICAGGDEFCRDPYQPETLGEQWYPFFPLQLWRVNGYLFARALVDNLIELVDEYNTRRTSAAEHRRKNKPVRIFNKAAGITDEEISAINRRGDSTDIIGVTVDPNSPLQNQLGSLPEIPYDAVMYETQDILRDIEMVSGAQDASRGAVSVAKTAREAEIQAMGMQSRTGEQLDAIEEWLTAIMIYCAQLLLLNLTPEQVKAKFGEEAVWPALDKKELFEQVTVQIRAGSTAKPNKMRERDQWLQFLPQLNEAIIKVSELEANGQVEIADALMKVLDETLRRFDERLSIKEFMPDQGGDGEEGGEQKPNLQKMLQIAQKKIAEMSQQAEAELAQRKQEIDKQDAELQRRATELEVKEIQFTAEQEVAGIRRAYESREHKLDAREAADEVVRKVTALLDQNAAAAQAQAGVVDDTERVASDVHAIVAPALAVINPPEQVEFMPDQLPPEPLHRMDELPAE